MAEGRSYPLRPYLAVSAAIIRNGRVLMHSEPALDYLVETFTPNQVYLGTDYPFDMGLGDPLAVVDAITTTDAAGKQRIREGNARAALRL